MPSSDESLEPVRDLQARAEGESVLLSWSQPARGEVRVYRLTGHPLPSEGQSGPLVAFAALGEPIDCLVGWARDERPLEGEVFYLPITTLGSQAVAGRAVSFTGLPDVSEVRAHDCGHYVSVTWRSRGNPFAKVAWSKMQRPTREGGDHQYEQFGETDTGFRIEGYDGGPLHVAVFAGYGVPGAIRWAEAASFGSYDYLSGRASMGVRYRVQVRGWPLRPKRLVFGIERTHGIGALPPLTLVARPGRLPPLTADDGEQLLRVAEHTSLPFIASVDLGALRLPLTLCLFAEDEGSVAITPPAVSLPPRRVL